MRYGDTTTVYALDGQARKNISVGCDIANASSSRLAKIKCGRGIFISVMKTIEVLLGQELRTLCEAARKASKSRTGSPAALHEVRSKHSQVFATSLDGQTMSKIDTLLADIEQSRTVLSMELSDHDELYAATCM